MFLTQLALLWIFPGTTKRRIRLICLVFSNTLLWNMSRRTTMPCCFRIFMKEKHLASRNYFSKAAPGSTYCHCQNQVNRQAARLTGEGGLQPASRAKAAVLSRRAALLRLLQEPEAALTYSSPPNGQNEAISSGLSSAGWSGEAF